MKTWFIGFGIISLFIICFLAYMRLIVYIHETYGGVAAGVLVGTLFISTWAHMVGEWFLRKQNGR